MHVSQSLTFKQVSIVAAITSLVVGLFFVIQLFYSVEQRKREQTQQLELAGHEIASLLASTWHQYAPAGMADVLTTGLHSGYSHIIRVAVTFPAPLPALSIDLHPERPVPALIASLFALPLRLTIPIELSPAASQTVTLILEGDAYAVYGPDGLLLSLSVYLLLILVLTLSTTWGIRQWIVKPLHATANTQPHGSPDEQSQALLTLPLTLPSSQQEDKSALLVQSDHRNPRLPMVADTENMLWLHEHEIVQALEQKQFQLFLQPQWNMVDDAVVGAEALLRWRQPDGHYSLPSEIITLAETQGGIIPLGCWVLEEVCRILSRWQQCGVKLQLAFNVSVVQMQHRDVVTQLESLINYYQLDASQLMLEVTETVPIADLELTLTHLRSLKQLGVSIALDDFGTGYTSLNDLDQLKSLPLDMLKIDKNFISHLPDDDVMVRIISAIAQSLHLSVVSEGIETVAQRDWLLAHGLNLGQGYLFSRPISQADFERTFCGTQIKVS